MSIFSLFPIWSQCSKSRPSYFTRHRVHVYRHAMRMKIYQSRRDDDTLYYDCRPTRCIDNLLSLPALPYIRWQRACGLWERFHWACRQWRNKGTEVTKHTHPLLSILIILGGGKNKAKVAHTRLPRVPELIPILRSQPAGNVSQTPAVGCHYFPPGLQLSSQSLKGLLPILLLGEQRHNGCEQFA